MPPAPPFPSHEDDDVLDDMGPLEQDGGSIGTFDVSSDATPSLSVYQQQIREVEINMQSRLARTERVVDDLVGKVSSMQLDLDKVKQQTSFGFSTAAFAVAALGASSFAASSPALPLPLMSAPVQAPAQVPAQSPASGVGQRLFHYKNQVCREEANGHVSFRNKEGQWIEMSA